MIIIPQIDSGYGAIIAALPSGLDQRGVREDARHGAVDRGVV